MSLVNHILAIVGDNTIKSGADAAVLAFHSFMLSQGLLCIGLNDESAFASGNICYRREDGAVACVVLPKGWNQNDFAYSFVYACAGDLAKKVHMRVVTIGDSLAVNIAGTGFASQGKLLSLEFAVNELVKDARARNVQAMFNDFGKLERTFTRAVEGYIDANRAQQQQFIQQQRPQGEHPRDGRTPPPPGSQPQPQQPQPPFGVPPVPPFYYPYAPDPNQPRPGPGFFYPDGNLIGPDHPGFQPDRSPNPLVPGPQPLIPQRPGQMGPRFDPFGPLPGRSMEPDPDLQQPPNPGYEYM